MKKKRMRFRKFPVGLVRSAHLSLPEKSFPGVDLTKGPVDMRPDPSGHPLCEAEVVTIFLPECELKKVLMLARGTHSLRKR